MTALEWLSGAGGESSCTQGSAVREQGRAWELTAPGPAPRLRWPTPLQANTSALTRGWRRLLCTVTTLFSRPAIQPGNH